MQSQNFNIAMIGLGGVGKTSFLNRLKANGFGMVYTPSSGKTITRITRGNYTFDITEFAGQEQYSMEMTKPLTGYDAIICITDTQRLSYVNAVRWHDRINTSLIPSLFVRNKNDINTNFYFRTSKIEHTMSTKTGRGVEELLEKLVSKME